MVVRNLATNRFVTEHIPNFNYVDWRLVRVEYIFILRSLLVFVVGLTMIGCSVFEEPMVLCPSTRVLEDPAKLTRFKAGSGRDITDIQFEAAFDEIVGSCKIDDDEIEIELKLRIFIKRGAADNTRQASFSFFIAIVDPDRKVISYEGTALHKSFNGLVEFPGNQTRAHYTDEFELVIPKLSGQSVDDFLIFIGFELTNEELKYNRSRDRR